jgi:hypothetical protein
MITSVTNGSVCSPGGVVNLAATGNGTINWYDALTGGTLLNTGNTYSPNVSATTTYYVEAQVVAPAPQTLAMPAQSNTFPGNVRGYWFTAPVDFVMTGLFVPTTASSGNQQVAVVKFNGNTPPPVFSATTNAFTTLFLTRNNVSSGSIAVNIPVQAGEVIGILGNRADLNSYAPGDYNTTIAGFPIQLQRLGMQFPLSTTNPQNIWREFGAGTSISRIEFSYASVACNSTPRVPVTATVHPLPVGSATAQTICSAGTTSVALSSTTPVAGTTYAYTAAIQTTPTGGTITGQGSGTANPIAQTLTNTGTTFGVIRYTVTPIYSNGGQACAGASFTVDVTVDPTNTITLTSVPTLPAVIINPDYEILYKSGSTTVRSPLFANGNFTGAPTGINMPGPLVTFSDNTTGSSFDMAGWSWSTIMGVTNVNSQFGAGRNMIALMNGVGFAGPATEQVMTQTLNENLQQNVTYTLTADFGWRNDNGIASVPPVLRLYAGATLLTPVTSISPALVKGSFVTYTRTYNINNIAISGPLRIETGLGANVNAQQLNIDHVTLTRNSNAVQTVCVNTPISPITYNTTGATGASFAGLPLGVNGTWAANVITISGAPTSTGTFNYTVNLTGGCGALPTTGTIVVNTAPTAVATPASQTQCSANTITPIVLSGSAVAGTVYDWTRDNLGTVTGIAASGTGFISGSLTNITNAPVTVTFTITPSANGCAGTQVTATVVVNPRPTGSASPQTICSAGTTSVALSSTTPASGTTYAYTAAIQTTPTGGTITGQGSGTVNPIAQTLTNTGSTFGVIRYTVTPTFTNAGVSCAGAPFIVDVTVNSILTLTTTTMATCVGGNIGSIDLTVSGGTPLYGYLWSNSSTTQDISGLGVGTYTVTVTDMNNCTATTSASITTLPLPCGWSAEPNGVGCNAGNSVAYNFTTQRFTVTSTNCYYPNSFTNDALAFAQYDLCGNGSITAQVTSITPLGQGWAGVTMRENNAAGAKKAQLMTNLSNFSRREFRTTTGGQAYPQQFPSQNRYWLRITRTGNQFVMYISPNGTTWYPAGAQNISMNNCIEVGLVVTNYTANSTVTATFANVSVTGAGLMRPTLVSGEDQFAAADFSIMPNPSNGWIEVDLRSYGERKVQMDMYNLQGKLLRSTTVETNRRKEEIDLSVFANGMYLLRVRAEGLPDVTKRVVKID